MSENRQYRPAVTAADVQVHLSLSVLLFDEKMLQSYLSRFHVSRRELRRLCS